MTTTSTAASLTPKCTAFVTFAQLESALRTGYVPTMSRRNAKQLLLGEYLESRGYRVFWTL